MELFCHQPGKACVDALTQGDVWDIQKDMAFAIIGSLIALVLHSVWGSKTRKQEH
jgi:uncharacterized membrane protein YjdF